MFLSNLNYYMQGRMMGSCSNGGNLNPEKLVFPNGQNGSAFYSLSSFEVGNDILTLMRTIAYDNFYAISSPTSSSYLKYGTVFGTGTTPPSTEDYKLSGDYISMNNVSYTRTEEAHADGYTVTWTLTNKKSEDITIGEIGLITFVSGQTVNYSSTKSYMPILLERTVLDTPVTIPAGGVGQVTYTIRFNYPTA